MLLLFFDLSLIIKHDVLLPSSGLPRHSQLTHWSLAWSVPSPARHLALPGAEAARGGLLVIWLYAYVDCGTGRRKTHQAIFKAPLAFKGGGKHGQKIRAGMIFHGGGQKKD